MFKPIVVTPETVAQVAASAEAKRAQASSVFKVMHGFYGNLFLSKFASGQLNDAGDDIGVINARSIWGHGLVTFDELTIKTALSNCMDRHPEFPPSLPQFVLLCRAATPRKVYRPAVPEIEMSQGLRSEYARKAREINTKHAERAQQRVTGFIPLPMSLDGLKQSIAQAVALAGGDEAATLMRLDRELAPREAA
jgi:hypothetical protein